MLHILKYTNTPVRNKSKHFLSLCVHYREIRTGGGEAIQHIMDHIIAQS